MQNLLNSRHTAAALLVVLALIAYGTAANTARVSIGWSIPVGPVRSLALSPCGHYAAAVSGDGHVSLYDPSGMRCYSTRLLKIDSAVVSPDGKFTLAYSRMDRGNPFITILDGGGRVYWKMKVSGAVWSADACRSKDGARFAVGTGDRRIYVIDIGRGHKRYRRWRVAGTVVSVGLDRDGEKITFGAWQESVIGCGTARGKRIWESDVVDSASLHFVRTLEASDRALVRSVPNKVGGEGVIAMYDAEGDIIWQTKANPSGETRVLASPNGRYVCLGRETLIEHKGKCMRERHTVLLDSRGRRLWEKGSLFFPASPILVSSTGVVLVSDGKNGLFIISRSGDIEPSVKLGAPIHCSIASRDGSRVLVHCVNGKLCMIRT